MGARRAPQAISGSTKKTSPGAWIEMNAPRVTTTVTAQRTHVSVRPLSPGWRNSSMKRDSRISWEARWVPNVITQDFPGHAEVGDGGGEGEQDGACGRADHGREGEAREVEVVVEATAVAPPHGQHLQGDETLDDDGDGVRRPRPRAGSRPGRRWRGRAPRRRRRGRARPAVRRTPARRRPDPPATSHRCGCRPVRRGPLPVRATPASSIRPATRARGVVATGPPVLWKGVMRSHSDQFWPADDGHCRNDSVSLDQCRGPRLALSELRFVRVDHQPDSNGRVPEAPGCVAS